MPSLEQSDEFPGQTPLSPAVPRPVAARRSRGDQPRSQVQVTMELPENDSESPVPLNDIQFSIEVEHMLFQAKKEYTPFWPLFGFFVGSLDVFISIGTIVLGTLIATYSNSDHRTLIRVLAIASTILAGIGALLQGTVSLVFGTIVTASDAWCRGYLVMHTAVQGL